MLIEFLRDYGSVVAWIIIVLGWVVVGHQSDKRERKKEIKADIKEISEKLNFSCDLLKKLLNSAPGETKSNIYLDLTMMLFEVDQDLERLLKRRFNNSCTLYIDRCKNSNESFFDLSTGDDVLKEQPSEDEKNSLLMRTHANKREIIHELNQIYLCEFDS